MIFLAKNQRSRVRECIIFIVDSIVFGMFFFLALFIRQSMSHHSRLIFISKLLNILLYFTEQQRDNDRSLRKAGREIERERRKLEEEEKKIVRFFI